jgi:dipeptidyl aminopeptidase/acylaminoacyl peptidase
LGEAVGNLASWAPDGREIAVVRDEDIWIIDTKSEPPSWRPQIQGPGSHGWPAFSPDGRWIAWASYRSGRAEVYLQPYPGAGPRRQVSVDGALSPAWSPDGAELFFHSATDGKNRARMMAVSVSPTAGGYLGVPRAVFAFDPTDLLVQWPVSCYAVAPDGQHFYATQAVETDPPPPVTRIDLVPNWRAELEAKVPSGL